MLLVTVTLEAATAPRSTIGVIKRRSFTALPLLIPDGVICVQAIVTVKAAGAVQVVEPLSQMIVMVWPAVILEGEVN